MMGAICLLKVTSEALWAAKAVARRKAQANRITEPKPVWRIVVFIGLGFRQLLFADCSDRLQLPDLNRKNATTHPNSRMDEHD
jgi:hypothetical protein